MKPKPRLVLPQVARVIITITGTREAPFEKNVVSESSDPNK